AEIGEGREDAAESEEEFAERTDEVIGLRKRETKRREESAEQRLGECEQHEENRDPSQVCGQIRFEGGSGKRENGEHREQSGQVGESAAKRGTDVAGDLAAEPGARFRQEDREVLHSTDDELSPQKSHEERFRRSDVEDDLALCESARRREKAFPDLAEEKNEEGKERVTRETRA